MGNACSENLLGVLSLLLFLITQQPLLPLAHPTAPEPSSTAATTPTPTPTPSLQNSTVSFEPLDKFHAVPRRTEPNQPITIKIEGLPADVVSGSAEACVVFRNAQGQEIDSWRLAPETDQTREIRIWAWVEPGDYQLTVEICTLIEQNVIDAKPQLEPLATLPFAIKPRSNRFAQPQATLSPDGQSSPCGDEVIFSPQGDDWCQPHRRDFNR